MFCAVDGAGVTPYQLYQSEPTTEHSASLLLGIGTGLLPRQQSETTTEHSASLLNTEPPYGSPPSHTTPTYGGNDHLSCSAGAPIYLHPSDGATTMERFNCGIQPPPHPNHRIRGYG